MIFKRLFSHHYHSFIHVAPIIETPTFLGVILGRSKPRGSCPSTSFECADGSRCLPGYEVCNAIVGCDDASDEANCVGNPWRLNRPPEALALTANFKFSRQFWAAEKECPFRCGNGSCRAVDVVCSGKDGCGDDSDEANCRICSELLFSYAYILDSAK